MAIIFIFIIILLLLLLLLTTNAKARHIPNIIQSKIGKEEIVKESAVELAVGKRKEADKEEEEEEE